MWSDAESTVGILSSCLLTYGPLWHVVRRKIGIMSRASGSYQFSTSRRSALSSNRGDFKPGMGVQLSSKETVGIDNYIGVDSDGASDTVELTLRNMDNESSRGIVEEVRHDWNASHEDNPRGIQVQREVCVTREDDRV
jgi:hypothetical protein